MECGWYCLLATTLSNGMGLVLFISHYFWPSSAFVSSQSHICVMSRKAYSNYVPCIHSLNELFLQYNCECSQVQWSVLPSLTLSTHECKQVLMSLFMFLAHSRVEYLRVIPRVTCTHSQTCGLMAVYMYM